jgi:SAM-dependent methyltransferase
MRGLASFIDWNRRACGLIRRFLPQAREDLSNSYLEKVAEVMNGLPPGATVADVGSGRSCPFARLRGSGHEVSIVGVDVSADELELNRDVDERRVADVVRGLPFGDGEVDCIVSRSVIEHLPDTERFVFESYRALKPGGWAIHLFPSRFAPFALINQLLPHRLARGVLHALVPDSHGRLGFRAHYDRCYASAMAAAHERAGFELVDLQVSYYQSEYFTFFLPAYALSVAYELVPYSLRARNLAAYVLLVVRKPTTGAAALPS